MPKKRLAEEEQPQTIRPDSAEEILAKIATLNKREGIKSNLVDDSIYFYELRMPDFNSLIYLRFHGKCVNLGLEKYISIGYIPTVTHSIKSNDLDRSRTTCQHCNQQLNPKLAKQLMKLKEQRRIERHEQFLNEQAIQLEKDKELVLLGLL